MQEALAADLVDDPEGHLEPDEDKRFLGYYDLAWGGGVDTSVDTAYADPAPGASGR